MTNTHSAGSCIAPRVVSSGAERLAPATFRNTGAARGLFLSRVFAQLLMRRLARYLPDGGPSIAGVVPSDLGSPNGI
jgi:hypothetical protein